MEQRLTHWEKRVVSLVKKYGRLIQEHHDDEILYFVDGFGKVGGKAPGDLIARKVLVPTSDGLFPDHSQTYTLETANAAQ